MNCKRCGEVIDMYDAATVDRDGNYTCASCFDTKPVVAFDFDGPDGNSFFVLGTCKRAARKAGWSHETIEAFLNEAMSSDRDHLMDVVFAYFTVARIEHRLNEVDRAAVK